MGDQIGAISSVTARLIIRVEPALTVANTVYIVKNPMGADRACAVRRRGKLCRHRCAIVRGLAFVRLLDIQENNEAMGNTTNSSDIPT